MQATCRRLGVGEECGVIPDRRMRHFRGSQSFPPIFCAQLAHGFFQERHKNGPVLDAQGVRREARIGRQILQACCLAETLPLTVIADGQHEPTVGGGEQLVGDDLQVGIALARRSGSARQIGCPERDRACRQASTTAAAYRPVKTSVTATPALHGGPSTGPVMFIKPLKA